MRSWYRPWLALAVLQCVNASSLAQQPAQATPARAAVAATINGETVPEVAVQRGLQFVPAAKQAEERGNILNVLIDNVLVSQYLTQSEITVVKGLAKLKPDTDNLARQNERARLTEEAFAALARDKSACPSKEEGGDVGWFPRIGNMVEPFAKAAFALKPYEMSDVVTTQFGHHLILATDRKPGKEVKFEERKEAVKALFGERLRESLCAQLRQNARIVINP